MAVIEEISLPPAGSVQALWAVATAAAQHWLAQRGLPARDTVMLLPFAALLAPARAAWAAAGGWQPRVETPLTLAASLGPPLAAVPGACNGDPTLDALAAATLLQRQPWGAAWEARDAAGFARVVSSVVQAAQVLRSAALARAPRARESFWTQVRALCGAAPGPAATEALLLRVALEWAAASDASATDRLFALRPSAWIAVQIGGPDPLVQALLGSADTPSLRLSADPPDDDPFGAVATVADVRRLCCADFEAEAQAAATEVIDALNAGGAPVALVALDRELVRRVRALLERAAVPLLDETGWRLATTRAAASVVVLLRAAPPHAGPDARLEWLKSWPPAPPAALDSLEALWRGRRHVPSPEAAERLWRQAQAHLQPLAAAVSRPLAGWLDLLHERLASDGSLERLEADPAGVQVLAALAGPGGAAWQQATTALRLDLAGFTGWVESTLQELPFLPPPDAHAQVVITPLARAFGRPFGRIVMPGADEVRLGAASAPPALIGEAMAQALGLEHALVRRLRQRLALAQVLRAGPVTLLRRLRDGDEPLAESPDVEWLVLARQRSGAPAWPQLDWQPATTTVRLQAVNRPAPRAAAALPETLSASQLETLRQCPYRFFARAVLRLDEPDELEASLAKRDYGTWLHAVLHRFHRARDEAGGDRAHLLAAADAVTQELELDEAELLPFRASFESFVPAYLAWLRERESRGWRWFEGETDREVRPPELAGLRLRGRLDRLDHGPGGLREVLDYKTGGAAGLKQKVARPLEDTQLAFYAALLGGDAKLGAAYVALDDAGSPLRIEHPEVHQTAQALLCGLGDEWARLRQGQPLPALGEGRVCETCEARGLCRRDQWGPA
ncbi:MAG: PD-(D/E)XK nuclease family protein [Rubrivivax sp.]|nr:PD-(D/E)XK nuclease family protein [Rubrivivax sp.]